MAKGGLGKHEDASTDAGRAPTANGAPSPPEAGIHLPAGRLAGASDDAAGHRRDPRPRPDRGGWPRQPGSRPSRGGSPASSTANGHPLASRSASMGTHRAPRMASALG